jgi:GNAT superfamily N-acetyltransferase
MWEEILEDLMEKMIENTSSDELVTAMDSNLIAFWAAYGRGNGSTLYTTSDVVWFYTGIQFPLFNGVLYAKLKPTGVKAVIDSLQAKIDEQGASALWWISPQSKPDNLGSLLEQQGLKPAGETPGMAIDLVLLENKPETITNFTIRKVGSMEMQALWARIAAIGTGFSDIATEEMVRLEETLSDPQYKAQHRYIGFLNDTPVATSALVLDSGVAGIYAVATIPEARRKGIGRFMTLIPLLEAKQIGYRVGILQASSMGYQIYKKIGFKDICKYRTYLQS